MIKSLTIPRSLSVSMFVHAIMLVFVMQPNVLSGQMAVNVNKDSILALLRKMPADTNKVLTYITVGQQYEETQPDSAIFYYKEAKRLSEVLNYPVGIIKYISNYTAVLNVQGKFDESLKLNMEAVRLSEKHRLKRQMLASYTNMGAVYQHKDDNANALTWYLKALPLLEEDGNQQNLGIFYSNLCVLYKDLQQYDKAIAAGKRAVNIGTKTSDLYIEGSAANNLGQVYLRQEKLPEALTFMQRTYDIGQMLPSIYFQQSALLGLATVYLKKEMPSKYIPMFQRALPLADSLDDIKGKVNALTGIGIGFYFTRKFQEAEEMFTKSISLATAYDLKLNLKEAYLHLSDLYIAKGNLEAGERTRAKFDSVENLLINERLAKNVQEMETRYNVEKQQREILQKNLLIEKTQMESSRQRNWLIISITGLILLLLLLLFIYRFYRQKITLDKQQLEALKTEQENIRLKAIVEGQLKERQRISQEMHDDMGSGLTSILFLSHSLNKPADQVNTMQVAAKLKSTASGLIEKMNEIIWMLNDNHDTLNDLLAYMRVNLAETVDNAGMDFQFNMPTDVPDVHLSQMHRRNIYLIVKEAVHNAIKHADASRISIDVQLKEGLTITVSDNGKGMDTNNLRLFSNGLKNMQQRAGHIQGEVTFHSEKGTRLELRVDLKAA
jgi:two-component system, NarL family, sensor kinase